MKNIEMILDQKAEKLHELFNQEFTHIELDEERFSCGEEHTIWFAVNNHFLNLYVCLTKEGYSLETMRESDERPRNEKTVKSEKAVINYIKSFF